VSGRCSFEAAAEAGVSGRCSFEVAPADAYPGAGYDLVAVFDALHDMGDLLAEAGFGRFRRATETPFDRVFETRP
jgi:hypothetical protein